MDHFPIPSLPVVSLRPLCGLPLRWLSKDDLPWMESCGRLLAGMMLMIAVVCCVLNLLSFWVSANLGNGEQRQLEKLLAFECGLEPLGDSRSMKFEILFFLVALLYLIFDLEIVLLFPLAITCTSLFSLYSPLAFSALLLFLILLTAAFLYEWLTGALDVADDRLLLIPSCRPSRCGLSHDFSFGSLAIPGYRCLPFQHLCPETNRAPWPFRS